jgi:uncharacterized protein YkwD
MKQRPQRFIKSMCIVLHISILWSCQPDDVTPREEIKLNLLEQINKLRITGCVCGNEWMPPVSELTWNPILENVALDHATDMYQNNYFSHLSLDGTPPITRAQNAGYSGNYVGEVLARRYHTVKDVTEAWQKSESHCRALMDSLYNEVGGARKEDYWVVDLGKSD